MASNLVAERFQQPHELVGATNARLDQVRGMRTSGTVRGETDRTATGDAFERVPGSLSPGRVQKVLGDAARDTFVVPAWVSKGRRRERAQDLAAGSGDRWAIPH